MKSTAESSRPWYECTSIKHLGKCKWIEIDSYAFDLHKSDRGELWEFFLLSHTDMHTPFLVGILILSINISTRVFIAMTLTFVVYSRFVTSTKGHWHKNLRSVCSGTFIFFLFRFGKKREPKRIDYVFDLRQEHLVYLFNCLH